MITLVIPVYNEEVLIDELFRRTRQSQSSISETFEVIFVDDGSTDSTLEKLKACNEKDKRFKVLTLSRNFGHQAAYTAAYVTPEKTTSLPALSDIVYGIDLFAEDPAFLKIQGWAAFQNQDADNCEISLVLKGKIHTYSSPTEQMLRPDVTAAIKKYKLDSTGFKSKIIKTALPKDQYQLGILIKDKKSKKEGVVFIDKWVKIS